ncbi:MAG: thioesterase family protein [Bacteroidales bacterium]
MYANTRDKTEVRYGDTDQMGFMYYGNYPSFFEVARTELLRSVGLPYRKLEEQGVIMPVTGLNIKYIKPAFYDDEITIKTFLLKLEGVRIHIGHELFNEKGELLTTAEISLVFIDAETNRPRRPPDIFVEKLMPFKM